MPRSLVLLIGITLALGVLTADVVAQPTTVPAVRRADATLRPSVAATTQPALNNVTGTVRFAPAADGQVRVTATISGLTPGGTHAIHIHEKPDMSGPTLDSTGGHFNPDGHPHGAPTDGRRHAGDFGNLTADADGTATLDLIVSGLSIGTGDPNDILGKPVIVHARPDDLKTQPSGNAGARVAGGIIERAGE